jgi:hypothetical protein
LFKALDVSFGLFQLLFEAFSQFVRRGRLRHLRKRFHQLVLGAIQILQFV